MGIEEETLSNVTQPTIAKADNDGQFPFNVPDAQIVPIIFFFCSNGGYVNGKKNSRDLQVCDEKISSFRRARVAAAGC